MNQPDENTADAEAIESGWPIPISSIDTGAISDVDEIADRVWMEEDEDEVNED
jgi:hypothetical protein